MWVWIAAVVLMAVLFFSCNREGLNNFIQYDGKDIKGTDLSYGKKDAAACESLCNSDPNCTFFVMDVKSGTGNCWTKKDMGAQSTVSNRYARVKTAVYEGQSFECKSNPGSLHAGGTFRYTGNNVGSWYPSGEVASTWDPLWGPPNRLSVDCKGVTPGPTVSAHVDPPGWVKQANTNYGGSDIKGIDYSTPDKCMAECTATAACVGTVFDHMNDKCWVKSEMAAANKTPLTNVDSYIKPLPTPALPGWKLDANTDYSANTPSDTALANSSATACMTACDTNTNCKGVVFDTRDSKCYIKTGTLGGKTAYPGLHSYTKPVQPLTGWTLEKATNYPGNDIDNKSIDNSTAAACQDTCNVTAGCKGAVFDYANLKCWLKNALLGKNADPNQTNNAYIKPVVAPTPALVGWNLEVDSDYAGNTLSEIPNSTAGACNAACETNPECKGTVFNTANKTCYLKKSMATKTAYPGLDSYTKPTPAPADWTLETGTDYPGNTIGSAIPNSTVDSCSTACLNAVGCKGFVFDAAKNCSLKSTLATKNTDAASTNAYKRPAPPAPLSGWTFEADADYAGNELSNTTSTAAACQTACEANAACKGAVFDTIGQTCSLKSALPTKTERAGLYAYLKPAPTAEPAPSGWTLEADSRYGGTFKETADGTVTDCINTCAKTPGCLGIGMDASVCRQYSEFSADAKSTVVGYNTYKNGKPLKIPTPARDGWSLEADTQYEGEYETTTNSLDCVSTCATKEGCLGVGIDANNECRTYSAFSDKKSSVVGYNTYINGTPYTSFKTSNAPTDAPTDTPTDAPTDTPTNAPTDTPTNAPTDTPTNAPTDTPTNAPTNTPTNAPTNAPTDTPTDTPTNTPNKSRFKQDASRVNKFGFKQDTSRFNTSGFNTSGFDASGKTDDATYSANESYEAGSDGPVAFNTDCAFAAKF